MREQRNEALLRWSGSVDTADLRTDQYIGPWQLVVLDHRKLPELISQAQA